MHLRHAFCATGATLVLVGVAACGGAGTHATVSTFAGSGNAGFQDGPATTAQVNHPQGVAIDAAGTVYVADTGNNRVRRITRDGTVTTLAGSGTAGYQDGTGPAAAFNQPEGIAVDTAGTVYVADTGNDRIRAIAPDGTVRTLAGSGADTSSDGPAANAGFAGPVSIAVDGKGTVYVVDGADPVSGPFGGAVRMIAPDGTVSTRVLAQGSAVGPLGSDGAGNVYVAKLDASGGSIITLRADGSSTTRKTTTKVGKASGITADSAGNVYVVDGVANDVVAIALNGAGRIVAGPTSGQQAGFADGSGTHARFAFAPTVRGLAGIAVDGTGHVYVADTGNNRVREVTGVGA
jgi:sugar lactone lactonase YvrE